MVLSLSCSQWRAPDIVEGELVEETETRIGGSYHSTAHGCVESRGR